MLTADLLIIATKEQKQPRCPSTAEWITSYDSSIQSITTWKFKKNNSYNNIAKS